MKFKKHKHKSKLIIIENETILVLKKNEKKRYVLVGGFLKNGESPEDGLIREVKEETGVNLVAENFKYYATSTCIDNNKNALSRHYFILIKNGFEFKNNEPEKFQSLQWVEYNNVLKFINYHDKNTIKRLFNSALK